MTKPLSYSEFLDKVVELRLEARDYKHLSAADRERVSAVLRSVYETEGLSITWVTGGSSGRSCWGNDLQHGVEAEPEPEFKELDELLEVLCPSISFLQYKKLLGRVNFSTTTSYDYYNNYTNYAKKLLTLPDLYNYLIEAEVVK